MDAKNRNNKLCSKAVQEFWNNERELIKKGQGTREWTPKQQKDIMNYKEDGVTERKNAKPPKDENGKSFEGHHMKSAEKIINNVKENDEIQVTIQNGEGTEILFTGIPAKVDIDIKRHDTYLILECYSGTYDMDMRESSRSFQDVSMEYSDMFKFVMGHYEGGGFINAGAKGKTIDRPVIQYKEMDWQFLKRMASEIGTVLTADVTSKEAKLFLGIPEKNKSVAIGAEKPLRRAKAGTLLQEEHYYYETTIPNEHIKKRRHPCFFRSVPVYCR